TPQRWDLIVFRYPKDPSAKYLSRLVGLPGETIYIRDGAIWVNEVRVEPPTNLERLRYTADVGALPARIGTPENPWRLDRDEHCVLGDFSDRSSDSRFWGVVPGANIDGVVSL